MDHAALPAELLAMIARGVSVIVGSRDAQLRPSVMRAVGSRAGPAAGEITVYLSRPQSRQLLQDLAANGRIAVVFSQPSTHRSLQVKGSDARLRSAGPEDEPLLAQYVASMEREIALAGYAPELARAMLAASLDEVVAVSFRPEQAFDQTPGPRAGTPLGAP